MASQQQIKQYHMSMGLCDWPADVVPFEQSIHFVKNYQFSKNSFQGTTNKRRIGKGLFHVSAQFRGLTREQKEAVDAMVTETRGGSRPFLYPAVPTARPEPMFQQTNAGYPLLKSIGGPGYIQVATYGIDGIRDFHAGQFISITSGAYAVQSTSLRHAPKVRRLLTVMEDSPIRTNAGINIFDLKVFPDLQGLKMDYILNLKVEAQNPSLVLLFDEGSLPVFTETPEGYFDMSFEATQISEFNDDEYFTILPWQ